MNQADKHQLNKFVRLYSKYGMYVERVDDLCIFRTRTSARSVSVSNDLLQIAMEHVRAS